VVVFGGGFLTAKLAFEHPGEEPLKPLPHAALVLFVPRGGVFDEADRVDDAGEHARLDEAGAAAGVDAGDALAELEVGIHARGWVEEPRAQ
jgi:hypothetical protein